MLVSARHVSDGIVPDMSTLPVVLAAPAPDSIMTRLSVPGTSAMVSCVSALGGVSIIVTKIGGSTTTISFGVSSVYKPKVSAIRLGPADVSVEGGRVVIKIFEEVITSALESMLTSALESTKKGLSASEAFDSGEGRESLSAAVLAHFVSGSREPSVFTVAFCFPLASRPWPFR